jgi:hypothetical protein
MFTGQIGSLFLTSWQIGLALITLLLALLEEKLAWFEKLAIGPAWAYGAACALLLLIVELLGYTEAAVPFVYFQF